MREPAWRNEALENVQALTACHCGILVCDVTAANIEVPACMCGANFFCGVIVKFGSPKVLAPFLTVFGVIDNRAYSVLEVAEVCRFVKSYCRTHRGGVVVAAVVIEEERVCTFTQIVSI